MNPRYFLASFSLEKRKVLSSLAEYPVLEYLSHKQVLNVS